MTIELDKEKGPQIRVVQNREPPSFLNLFNGKRGVIISYSRKTLIENLFFKQDFSRIVFYPYT